MHDIVVGLIAQAPITGGRSSYGAMALVASDEVLAALAYGMLEYEGGIVFMGSPFVAAIVNRGFFRRRAPYFRESVCSLSPSCSITLTATVRPGMLIFFTFRLPESPRPSAVG